MSETKTKRILQDYLSLGYLYLLLLGITSQVIYYGFLNINIFNYADITDILLSPIQYICSNRKTLILFLISVMAFMIFIYYTVKKEQKTNKDISQMEVFESKLPVIAAFLSGLFVGTSIPEGINISQKLSNDKLKPNRELIFNDGKKEEVAVVGQNAQYIFYARKGEDKITVTPVLNNIKAIKKIEKEED